jgi:hypothetical protein
LAALTWSTELEDPVPGMITLQDAADHILRPIILEDVAIAQL